MKTRSMLLAFVLCVPYPYAAFATQTQDKAQAAFPAGQQTSAEKQTVKAVPGGGDDC